MLLNKTQQETSDNEIELQLGMASLKAMPSILSQKNLDSLELEKMPQTMTLTGFKKLKRQDLNTNLSLDRHFMGALVTLALTSVLFITSVE